MLHLAAADGSLADLRMPFPWQGPGVAPRPGDDPLESAARWSRSLDAGRLCFCLLVRRGGYAVAVVEGGQVRASKVGSRYVQSRTAAGGWSQQRFARRRVNQASGLATATADHLARVAQPWLAHAGATGWLITGGDEALIAEVLLDPRIKILAGLRRGPHLIIGDPKGETVRRLPELITGLQVTITDPVPGSIG